MLYGHLASGRNRSLALGLLAALACLAFAIPSSASAAPAKIEGLPLSSLLAQWNGKYLMASNCKSRTFKKISNGRKWKCDRMKVYRFDLTRRTSPSGRVGFFSLKDFKYWTRDSWSRAKTNGVQCANYKALVAFGDEMAKAQAKAIVAITGGTTAVLAKQYSKLSKKINKQARGLIANGLGQGESCSIAVQYVHLFTALLKEYGTFVIKSKTQKLKSAEITIGEGAAFIDRPAFKDRCVWGFWVNRKLSASTYGKSEKNQHCHPAPVA